MFADELGGNASRKRAEANRAKRRQLKQRQEAKRTPTTAASGSASGDVFTNGTTSVTTSTTTAPTGLFGASVEPLKKPAVVAQDKSLSAVEKAKILREQRADEAKRLKSALILQSFYRCWRSNQKVYQDQKEILRKRLSDVESLSKILKEKKGISFVPPPATTTALARQLLWMAKSIPYGKRPVHIRNLSKDTVELLVPLLNSCILPSVLVVDDDSNPFITWVESVEGKHRFSYFLHLMICAIMDDASPATCVQSITRCIEILLDPTNTGSYKPSSRRKAVCTYATSQLVQSGTTPITPGTREERKNYRTPFRFVGTSLDLVAVVRYYLMFVSGGPDPVPVSAADQREKCISEAKRQRGGTLFHLLWTVLQFYPSEKARAFGFIWTVPLLSWKLSTGALSLLVEHQENIGDYKYPMQDLMHAFIDMYTESMDTGLFVSFLPTSEVDLTMCPATHTQCLLANMSQIGRLCKAINGSDPQKIDFDFATKYYDFIAVLLDTVPLMTFSSRESAVEWITDGKGHHTPVVISSVVLDQCKAFTSDSFIRRIFNCAIDTEYFKTDKILAEKSEEDMKLEKELSGVQGTSSAVLAAKEARIDRNQPFWASSKWARRMKKNVTNLFSGEGRDKERNEEIKRVLVDSSAVSTKLAKGETNASDLPALVASLRRADFKPAFLHSLCRVYSVILARWAGGGGTDITSGSSDETLKKSAVTKAEVLSMAVLNALSFSTQILRVSWGLIQADKRIKNSVSRLLDADRGNAPIRAQHCLTTLSDSTKANSKGDKDALALLFLFVSCLCHTLIVTDDIEIHDLGKPMPLHQLRRTILLLKELLFKACCVDISALPCHVGCAMISASARAMSDLYNRSSRRPLCLPKVWLIPDLLEKELRSCKTHDEYTVLLSGPILRVCPQLVSFKRRLKLFERIVTTNRINIQGENSPNPFHSNPLKPARVAVIHRGRILEDGLATMNNLGSNMRERISVHYVSETGHKETGIDAGGLFKDFWTDLCAIAFDPNYALFAVTEGAGNCLFPSPLSQSVHGIDHLMLFAFLGRIL